VEVLAVSLAASDGTGALSEPRTSLGQRQTRPRPVQGELFGDQLRVRLKELKDTVASRDDKIQELTDQLTTLQRSTQEQLAAQEQVSCWSHS
jgi:TolA-binding protein